jgi:ferric-dicitrate binding protein FerR (iron transport regulator)
MANHENTGNGASGRKRRATGDDSIAKLLRLAGPRPAVPPDLEERVHDAVRNEWRNAVSQRRTFRWGVPAVLAATIVLAVALVSRSPELSIAPIASVAMLDGNGTLSGGSPSPGDEIYPGDVITTGDHGVALAVANGLSLRLAAGTTATFDSIEELTLRTGQIYADTGQSIYDDRSITVHTSVGSAKDVGTRFAVAFLDGDMKVAVREGIVDVSDRRGSYTAEEGDMLTLQPNEDVIVDKISAYDDSWDWAAALAPAFEIENRSLLDFLKWAARETGKELVFENDDVRMGAMKAILGGDSVSGFTPTEAVDAVVPTTRFEHRIEAGRIIIRDPAQ